MIEWHLSQPKQGAGVSTISNHWREEDKTKTTPTNRGTDVKTEHGLHVIEETPGFFSHHWQWMWASNGLGGISSDSWVLIVQFQESTAYLRQTHSGARLELYYPPCYTSFQLQKYKAPQMNCPAFSWEHSWALVSLEQGEVWVFAVSDDPRSAYTSVTVVPCPSIYWYWVTSPGSPLVPTCRALWWRMDSFLILDIEQRCVA